MDKNNDQELKDKGSSVDWPPPKNTTQEDKNSKKDKQDKKITTEVKQYTIIVPDPYIISPRDTDFTAFYCYWPTLLMMMV